MNKIIKTNVWRGFTAISSCLLAVMLCMTSYAWKNASIINSNLAVKTSKMVQREGEVGPADYFKSNYGDTSEGNGDEKGSTDKKPTNLTQEGLDRLVADEKDFCIQEQEEGTVLLMNKNKALPLQEEERKVTLFGHASVQPAAKANSAGGSIDSELWIDIRQALLNDGFSINQTLYDAYNGTKNKRENGYNNSKYGLGEEPRSFYTDNLKNTFEQFGDVAIVMLAREGGEQRDISKYEKASDNGEAGISHLALHKNEKDMLQLIKEKKDAGVFKKVVVIMNTTNPIEVYQFEEYGVDAYLWMGTPGTYGFQGVANLLIGKNGDKTVNPSAKLVDTYATNSLSAPAVVNFVGDNNVPSAFLNAAEVNDGCQDEAKFVQYYTVSVEGIYVGYRYYETRYADAMTGKGNATANKGIWTGGDTWNYSNEISHPFGFGLSYTTFTQELKKVEWKGKTVTAEIEVKNVGETPGKSVVEFYVQTPYIEGGVEKSAIQLVDFDKTKVLEKDETQTIKITGDASLFASYDRNSNDGKGGYIMDKGDYYFAIGDDVHSALNNILSEQNVGNLVDENGKDFIKSNLKKVVKLSQTAKDEKTYSISSHSGEIIENKFDNLDINYWIPDAVTYLSRSDWDTTYPTECVKLTATPEMIKEIDGRTYKKPEDAPKASDFKMGIPSGLKIVDMREVPYDDDVTWNKFIDQFSADDLVTFLYENGGVDRSIESIAMPAVDLVDGPDGLHLKGYWDKSVKSNITKGKVPRLTTPGCCTGYVTESVLASTWNKELYKKLGEFQGEDGLFAGVAGKYGTGENLHRSVFAGRNFEYFSEDPVISYFGGRLVSQGNMEKGLIDCPKHLCGNTQETCRNGLNMFATEQSFREMDLRCFEGSLSKGGTIGTMTAFNRLGCTATPHSSALLEGVLRKEWGFVGYNLTDALSPIMHNFESFTSGTDQYCYYSKPDRANQIKAEILKQEDGYFIQNIRRANKNIFYMLSRSNAMNGMTTNTEIVPLIPWWKIVLVGVDVTFGILLLGSFMMYVSSLILNKKEEI